MLTQRERKILELIKEGLSDYKIARRLSVDPPSVTISRKNAFKKLRQANEDLAWAEHIGVLKHNAEKNDDESNRQK